MSWHAVARTRIRAKAWQVRVANTAASALFTAVRSEGQTGARPAVGALEADVANAVGDVRTGECDGEGVGRARRAARAVVRRREGVEEAGCEPRDAKDNRSEEREPKRGEGTETRRGNRSEEREPKRGEGTEARRGNRRKESFNSGDRELIFECAHAEWSGTDLCTSLP